MKAVESDEDLMLNYCAGNARAFETLYTRHKGALYRYLLRRCGQAAVAEELYQEVWMKLIRARQRYTVRAKFTTYLYQLAHNLCIDYYRRQAVTFVNNQHGGIIIDEIEDVQSQQPDKQLEVQQQKNELMQLIATLPHEQREVFLLREEVGLSLEEIADVTGVNPETAKSRLRYAVNKLRAGMKEP